MSSAPKARLTKAAVSCLRSPCGPSRSSGPRYAPSNSSTTSGRMRASGGRARDSSGPGLSPSALRFASWSLSCGMSVSFHEDRRSYTAIRTLPEKVLALNYGWSLPEKRRIAGQFAVYGSNGIVGSHNKAFVPTAAWSSAERARPDPTCTSWRAHHSVLSIRHSSLRPLIQSSTWSFSTSCSCTWI